MGEWQPIETADVSRLFSRSVWSLVHTSDGRITLGMPYFNGPESYIWMTTSGSNCKGRGEPGASYLRDSVTHWMPLPLPPGKEKPKSSESGTPEGAA